MFNPYNTYYYTPRSRYANYTPWGYYPSAPRPADKSSQLPPKQSRSQIPIQQTIPEPALSPRHPGNEEEENIKMPVLSSRHPGYEETIPLPRPVEAKRFSAPRSVPIEFVNDNIPATRTRSKSSTPSHSHRHPHSVPIQTIPVPTQEDNPPEPVVTIEVPQPDPTVEDDSLLQEQTGTLEEPLPEEHQSRTLEEPLPEEQQLEDTPIVTEESQLLPKVENKETKDIEVETEIIKTKMDTINKIEKSVMDTFYQFKPIIVDIRNTDFSKLNTQEAQNLHKKISFESRKYEEELMRHMLSLDNVETLGNEDLRNKRKQVIQLIQKLLQATDGIKRSILPKLEP